MDMAFVEFTPEVDQFALMEQAQDRLSKTRLTEAVVLLDNENREIGRARYESWQVPALLGPEYVKVIHIRYLSGTERDFYYFNDLFFHLEPMK